MAGTTTNSAGKLAKWTVEQRRCLLTYRARAFGYETCLKKTLDEYPEAHPYSLPSIKDFLKSEQGRKELGDALDRVRKDAPTVGFSQGGSRLDALNETAERLLNVLRSYEKPEDNVKEVVAVSAEIRQLMAEIRREMDPYGLEDVEQDSIFGHFLRNLRKEQSRVKAAVPDIEDLMGMADPC